MATEKRLIDANALTERYDKRIEWLRLDVHDKYSLGLYHGAETDKDLIAEIPTVDAYTEEQVASIIQKADKLEAEERELRKQIAWLKSCLNCKIRKECPRHCGKVVHDCDHWVYGDPTVDAVEVVRCKDCRHCKYQDEDDDRGDCDIHDTWTTRTPEFFCCYGERRPDDH